MADSFKSDTEQDRAVGVEKSICYNPTPAAASSATHAVFFPGGEPKLSPTAEHLGYDFLTLKSEGLKGKAA